MAASFPPLSLRIVSFDVYGGLPPEVPILLRDYFFAYAYFRPHRGGIPEAFAFPPQCLPLSMEEQGESLGVSASGTEVYTASEGLAGPIHKAECTLVRRQATPPGKAAGGRDETE